MTDTINCMISDIDVKAAMRTQQTAVAGKIRCLCDLR